MSTQSLLKSLEEDDDQLAVFLINGRKNPPHLFGTQIAHDVIPCLYELFRSGPRRKRLNLVLRSNGGVLEAPLPIVSLVREFFHEFHVFVPENAHSAATLISLGADRIIMTPIASLSPVDPQVDFTGSENEENRSQTSFSVEDVAGYYKLLEQLRITDDGRVQALEYLIRTLPPALLGRIERVRELIHLLADRIIRAETIDETRKALIIKKLAEEIPSHNYWITVAEAEELGLPIERASDETPNTLDDLLAEYRKRMAEDQHELVIDIPDGAATLEKDYESRIH